MTEERITKLEDKLAECKQNVGERMLIMERDSIEKLTRLETSVEELKQQLHQRIPEWITRVEFTPVKLIAYGLVAIILTSVLTAVVALVVTGGR